MYMARRDIRKQEYTSPLREKKKLQEQCKFNLETIYLKERTLRNFFG